MSFLPARSRWPWAATAVLAFAACAPAPMPNTQVETAEVHADPPGVDYLRGVDSNYSVRLESLGDTELLGPDSVMRRALVAGDEDLYVAATLFQRDGVFTLDMIVINHSGEPVELMRDGLHLVDADGQWLSRVTDQPGAGRYGLRGQQKSEAPVVVYEVPDRDQEFTNGFSMGQVASHTDPRLIKRERTDDTQERSRLDDKYDEPLGAGATGVLTTPSAVRVRNGDGRPFWTYFSAEEVTLPVTALVMLEDQQLLFKFDH